MDGGVTWSTIGIPNNLGVLMNKSPFNFAFGMEAMIPVEIKLSTMRIKHYNESSNSRQETQNQVHLRMAIY